MKQERVGANLSAICVGEYLQVTMHDNCTITRKGGGKQSREEQILAALHGILGPAGAAAPGQHSQAGLRQRQASS